MISFSIIIPTFNRASLIPKTLNTIIEQTYFNLEIIIVDDGSTDDTTQAIQPYRMDPRIHYFKIKNSERGAARNFGVKKSTGHYITFLDSDDIFLPWHLATAHEKIMACHNPPVLHLGYEILHPDGRVDSLPPLPSPLNQKLLEGNFLSCMGVFLRRDVALENPFDEDRALAGSEDYELWLRIAARHPILVFPNVTSRLINHDNRSVITTNPDKLIRRMLMLDEKLQNDHAFMAVFGHQLSKFAAFRNLYLGLHLAISGERWMALKSLAYTIKKYPYVVFKYRFAVAFKKMILW